MKRLKQRENREDSQGDTKGNGLSWQSNKQVQKFDATTKNAKEQGSGTHFSKTGYAF